MTASQSEKPLWRESPGIVWKDYYRAVELSKMRQLMVYDESRFREDWELAISLAVIMGCSVDSEGRPMSKPHFERMLQGCFDRITAYTANNPDVVWRYFVEKDVR